MGLEEFIATYETPEMCKIEKLSPEQYECLLGQGTKDDVQSRKPRRSSS